MILLPRFVLKGKRDMGLVVVRESWWGGDNRTGALSAVLLSGLLQR